MNELPVQPAGADAPTALPVGDVVFSGEPYGKQTLDRVDRLGADGLCAAGRLEILGEGRRLVCLLRHGAPFLAAELEGEGQRRVLALRQLDERARRLSAGECSLIRHDETLVDLIAALLVGRRELLSATRLVDPYQILDGLGQEGADAVVSFERDGRVTLLSLVAGRPIAVYFTQPADDPGEGDPGERFLLRALAPGGAPGRLEVFRGMDDDSDPDAGKRFQELTPQGEPPPPVQVVVQIGQGRELLSRAFSPPEAVIGRDSRCEVFIDNLAVSRRHARIGWEKGRFFVEDLGSANGTRLHGQPVRFADLEIGDVIEIGKFRISLAGQRHLPGVQETLLLGSSGPGLTLEGEGQRVSIVGCLLVGRGEGVDVSARGLSVRPVHARLEDRGEGLRVECLAGGTVRVNGKTVREAPLTAGDRLEVGKSAFTLASAGPKSLAEAFGLPVSPYPEGG
jgi:FHA domain